MLNMHKSQLMHQKQMVQLTHPLTSGSSSLLPKYMAYIDQKFEIYRF